MCMRLLLILPGGAEGTEKADLGAVEVRKCMIHWPEEMIFLRVDSCFLFGYNENTPKVWRN